MLRINFILNFIQRHTINRSWTIYEQNTQNTKFELKNNPTVNFSQLVIPSNTLPYGKYKLEHSVYVKIDTGYLKDIENEINQTIKIYIELIPGGIALFCLENGLNFIRIGKKQTFELNPLKYAYDMDFLVKPESLDIKFYCIVIDKNNSVNSLEHISLNKSDDLKEFLNRQNNGKTSQNNCFESDENYFFDQTGKILTVKENTLESFEDKINLFVLTTEHFNKVYYQLVRVEKIEVNEIPVATIRYEYNKTF